MAVRPSHRQVEILCREAVRVIPEVLTAGGFGRYTCILHARVGVQALRELGVRARPLAVKLRVMNPALATHARAMLNGVNGGAPPTEEQLLADGSWEVDLGYPGGKPPPGARSGYDGHVLVIVEDRLGLDLTLDQAARPEKNIRVQPTLFPVARDFLSGQETLIADARSDGLHAPAMLVYTALPDERGFLTAPDWTEVGQMAGEVREVVRRLRPSAVRR